MKKKIIFFISKLLNSIYFSVIFEILIRTTQKKKYCVKFQKLSNNKYIIFFNYLATTNKTNIEFNLHI